VETFRAFSGLHAAALAAIALLVALAIVLARRRGPAPQATPAERAIGWAYLAAWVTTYTYFAFSDLRDPAHTYPLQLCHWTAAAAALLLITRRRWLRPIVYFWGLALDTQALITPALIEGPALFPFWFFWISHGMIVGVALYDVCALGYRPALRDYGIACAAAAGYVALVLPLNLAFGWNYGFVGPGKPGLPTILDLLGPWPERLVLIVLLAGGVMALLLLPWRLARRREQGLQSPS
jgi:hypothetical integral membrane protein (TIGR02206 family)